MAIHNRRVRAVQYFTKDYLNSVKDTPKKEIVEFLENYRNLVLNSKLSSNTVSRKLISMKVSEDLLTAFRFKCEKNGTRYQTKIQELMKDWVKK